MQIVTGNDVNVIRIEYFARSLWSLEGIQVLIIANFKFDISVSFADLSRLTHNRLYCMKIYQCIWFLMLNCRRKAGKVQLNWLKMLPWILREDVLRYLFFFLSFISMVVHVSVNLQIINEASHQIPMLRCKKNLNHHILSLHLSVLFFLSITGIWIH